MGAVDGRLPLDDDPRRRRAGLSPLRQGADALRACGIRCGSDRAILAPSIGEMIRDQIKSDKPAETQAEMLERYRETLY